MSMIGSFGLLSQQQITDLLREPETVHEVIHPEDRDIYADGKFHCVEKGWHGLHYLLNGAAWEGEPPLDFIVRGGTDVGDEDVGYGPARVFQPAELVAIVTALEPITDEMLLARFDPEKMGREQVYPGFNPDDGAWLVTSHRELQAVLAGGAKEGLGLIVWCD